MNILAPSSASRNQFWESTDRQTIHRADPLEFLISNPQVATVSSSLQLQLIKTLGKKKKKKKKKIEYEVFNLQLPSLSLRFQFKHDWTL